MSPPDQASGTLQPGGHRTVMLVVFGTILIDFVGFTVLIPVLPLFAEQLGATGFQVALMLTVARVSCAGSGPKPHDEPRGDEPTNSTGDC